jgi:arginyl-tRNA--protein-N-Asp/Glu arginylyltransferase
MYRKNHSDEDSDGDSDEEFAAYRSYLQARNAHEHADIDPSSLENYYAFLLGL